MAIVKKVRSRGAQMVIVAYGEVLFMPGGDVNNWTNRFVGRIRSFTRAAAPTNKRPRWAHYGLPLKQTIRSSRPVFAPAGTGAQLNAGVGSTAPHAYYVDQGTGIYNGGGPYRAKILPPWQHGSPSLYEATWRPGGPRGRRVSPVMIRGQRGQHFFEKGLQRAFSNMLHRSYQKPMEPRVSDLIRTADSGFHAVGNTTADATFIAQLKEWREWRNEAWTDPDRGLGRGGGIGSKAHEKYVAKATSGRPKTQVKKDAQQKAQQKADKIRAQAIEKDRIRFMQGVFARFGDASNGVSVGKPSFKEGRWTVTVVLKNGVKKTVVSSRRF